ncbi:class I adenylate-forming enzyme family protein [Nocardioides sp. HM23]|jgi:acyl-CoA synthetase (AMP-forming)/AMP-acid ligase II|uniref:class I adenylate-forming enzyme family protein n=1 Tax=Nocardioides bizhenqiangii TaxID=3095076 RepID=UPI002ACA2E50|nr:class I adenylate-forming enzyme family protein [Nocardioides sp. HM23]MDZ5621085.1 class I adenylate-forming enzyme family protein [Nocardioides sp. HM23]
MTTLKLELDEFQASLRGLSMPAALDRAAAVHGSRLAITHIEGGGPSVTWAEFRGAVSRVRSGLQALGVRAGDKVGLQLRNQLEFPLTWFAVAEIGAAVVPLNPRYTKRECEFVLEDSGASWLVVASDILATYVEDGRLSGPVARGRIVVVGDPGLAPPGFDDVSSFEELAATDATQFESYPDHDAVVNIQFTSGTTGLPKGCLLTHRYWIELGVWCTALNPGQRILADHPFYYMQNQGYLMNALASGGAIYVTAGLSRRKFLDWLVDHEIDLAWIDEGMLDFPVTPKDGELRIKRAPVAAVPPEDLARLEDRFDLLARDLYASTEVGCGTAVPWDRPDLAAKGSMGLCFPTRETKVVDENLEEVPTGVAGELCIRGEGMMLGYHNRPEVNAELFLAGGWFRTGDVVRKTADGAHYFEGRLKDMISRSGENIAAAEVEFQLLTMSEIEAVGVIPVPDPDRGEEVKAIVVLKPGADVTPAAVVEWAGKGLASFKVPRYLEFRDALPYTASGKVHKAALKEEPPFNAATVDVTRPGSRARRDAS